MNDALSLLGLVFRARKIVLGEEILRQIKKVRLMVIASDISASSRERLEKKCHYYGIDHIDTFDSRQLSTALGKNNVKAIGIIDAGFAEAFCKKL